MTHIHIPHELKKMNSILRENGFKAYLVGGAVRDILLKKEAHDWDLTTDARPDDIMRIFHKVIPTGIAHGTVTVHFMKKEIEITTFRAEQGYSDGRHPDRIFFADTIEEDLSRRDFTMNAIAADLEDGSIVDPYHGQEDIKNKIIRTVGNPHERFMEDGLRPIRALRFASQLDFSIEKDTYSEIFKEDIQKKITSISLERFRDEFIKIMLTPKPSKSLFLMEECGILKLFLPELAQGRGVTQTDARGFHEFDVLDHNIYSCDGAPQDNYIVRIAALLHDSGKVDVRFEKEEEDPEHIGETVKLIHFWNHEAASEKIAKTVLTRLKFSNAQIERVCHLIKEHMFYFQTDWTDAAVRRFAVRVGKDYFEDLFALRLADNYGKSCQKAGPESPVVQNILELKERLKKVEDENSALSLKDLKINGNDLINAGISPGKKIGYILNELFQTVLDDPQMNEKDKLLKVALNLDLKTKE
jgi:tRNA nucleotidyltransferase/poly(A) polymerase